MSERTVSAGYEQSLVAHTIHVTATHVREHAYDLPHPEEVALADIRCNVGRSSTGYVAPEQPVHGWHLLALRRGLRLA